MKYLFLIADGMGDWPLDELGGKTPLEAARTPHMDELARNGLVGTCRTVPQGMPPGSDVANMALLGFNPAEYHTGRGPIEAAAQGLKPGPDDLVWRLNLVTVSELSDAGTMHDYSAGHISTPDATLLVTDLQRHFGNDVFTLYPGVQYRHLLVQKNGALKPEADIVPQPPHDITDKSVTETLGTYRSCPALWELVRECSKRLADNPDNATQANAVWPWGQGRALDLPSFEDRAGLKGAVISAVDLIKGLGRAARMEVIDVPGATGLVDTNYAGKVQAALSFLEQGGDFVFVHLEGADECAHGGDVECKITALERFDEQVVAPMRQAMTGKDAAFMVTCDHLTPTATKTHHADPVPFAYWWNGCQAGSGAAAFTEAEAARGEHVAKGYTLIDWALARSSCRAAPGKG